MASFGNPKHKKKNFRMCITTFETQHSFWIKDKFDLMVRWKGLDKINVHKVYN
jgi:hypothetical protein